MIRAESQFLGQNMAHSFNLLTTPTTSLWQKPSQGQSPLFYTIYSQLPVFLAETIEKTAFCLQCLRLPTSSQRAGAGAVRSPSPISPRLVQFSLEYVDPAEYVGPGIWGGSLGAWATYRMQLGLLKGFWNVLKMLGSAQRLTLVIHDSYFVVPTARAVAWARTE